ncbi:MAG: acyl carrier protein [Victivallales bacterium]|nr:acyl carrier protein [Victivallales bacterium]
MADKSLELQLKELIVERLFLEIDADQIGDDTPLSDYGVDSFLLLELIVALEEVFDVKFEQSDITAEVLKTVASMAALVRSKNPTL